MSLESVDSMINAATLTKSDKFLRVSHVLGRYQRLKTLETLFYPSPDPVRSSPASSLAMVLVSWQNLGQDTTTTMKRLKISRFSQRSMRSYPRDLHISPSRTLISPMIAYRVKPD
ncbi:MAG: hypothetical protein Q9214_005862 [Letrouitia sp. 1 TL-2023]